MAVQFVDRIPTYPGRIKFTKEDGTVIYGVWERADNPTVEGTPLNAENLNAMQESAGLSSAVSIYVSTTGSNSTGDGTEAKPYATITKALSTLPKNLNGFDVTITVSPGIYAESVDVQYFYGGLIIFKGGEVTLSGFRVIDSLVEFSGMSLKLNGSTSSGDALRIDGGRLKSYNDITIETTGVGVTVSNGGQFYMISWGTLALNGPSYGVLAEFGGKAVLGMIEGSVTVLLDASTGSTISFEGNYAESTSDDFKTDSGGRILSGAQSNAPTF